MSERDVIATLDAEVARLQAENAALVAALRDAIEFMDNTYHGDGREWLRHNLHVRAALAAHAARTEGEGPR